MKRSEMVRHLMFEINYCDENNEQVNPERILEVIEEWGMLPPPVEVIIECNRGERKFKRNKWDEE